jgi:transposase InsO family protein
VNAHNAWVPRDHWLTPAEREAIIRGYREHPTEGYRRLTYMLLDADLVAVSPATTYRVLCEAGLMRRWARPPSKKGQGFQQPLAPHEHWHIDIAHLRIAGTFFFLCTVLDGCSRYIVHWELRLQMTVLEVELTVQRAKEKFPNTHARVISDNGPQFIAKDFKEFIALAELTHVRTAPYYPQSNGKQERWYQSFKAEAWRPGVPVTYEDGLRVAGAYVDYYNAVRLHSAIGYVTPLTRLEGRQQAVFDARDRKLEAARLRRAELCRTALDPLHAK